MPDQLLRLLIIGAHPDDADYHAGGLAACYRQAGHVVKMVSLTNGDAGHNTGHGTELACRRRKEAQAAGAVIGAEYEVFDIPDGQLLPSLDNRFRVIRLIREFAPDLILTHRPNDYHPDHRYTSQLVQDAAYMVTVPALVPDAPRLAKNPTIAYVSDHFKKPNPFEPTIAVDVGPVLDRIVDMLHCHSSQFYEWLPYSGGYLDQVPENEIARRDWLAARVRNRLRTQADSYCDVLLRLYGPACGAKIEYAEGFEACEYGAPLDDTACRRLFPFLGRQ
jgi:LmbE family N-acetylglucosaminyl deacetylase